MPHVREWRVTNKPLHEFCPVIRRPKPGHHVRSAVAAAMNFIAMIATVAHLSGQGAAALRTPSQATDATTVSIGRNNTRLSAGYSTNSAHRM